MSFGACKILTPAKWQVTNQDMSKYVDGLLYLFKLECHEDRLLSIWDICIDLFQMRDDGIEYWEELQLFKIFLKLQYAD